VQWVVEEAFAVALELHEAGQLHPTDHQDDQESAIARSLERLAKVKRAGG